MEVRPWLTEKEEETVKQSLLDFVIRVSSGKCVRDEASVLPDVSRILLERVIQNVCEN